MIIIAATATVSKVVTPLGIVSIRQLRSLSKDHRAQGRAAVPLQVVLPWKGFFANNVEIKVVEAVAAEHSRILRTEEVTVVAPVSVGTLVAEDESAVEKESVV